MNEQEEFWTKSIGEDYMQANSSFNNLLGIEAWEKMLSKIDVASLGNYLECGSNIGKNLNSLAVLAPNDAAGFEDITYWLFEKL